jgi:glycine cleavage system H protein
VVEVNEQLAESPEKLNQDPHGSAWLMKLRSSAPGELSGLLSADAYRSYIGAEA